MPFVTRAICAEFAAVDARLIVHARADTEVELDAARLALAIDSGARAVSTDVPAQVDMPRVNGCLRRRASGARQLRAGPCG